MQVKNITITTWTKDLKKVGAAKVRLNGRQPRRPAAGEWRLFVGQLAAYATAALSLSATIPLPLCLCLSLSLSLLLSFFPLPFFGGGGGELGVLVENSPPPPTAHDETLTYSSSLWIF